MLNKLTLHFDERKCFGCQFKTNEMEKDSCPRCGGFLYPITSYYNSAPKKEKSK